jgi:pimeloyl-ACP methyl ester carboxylesterase
MIHRIFIHGLESSNQGTKAVFFRDKYPDMILPDFEGPLTERMEKLNRILSGKSEIRIVGSSFGGLMAALFAMENPSQVRRMILLAPATNMERKTRSSRCQRCRLWQGGSLPISHSTLLTMTISSIRHSKPWTGTPSSPEQASVFHSTLDVVRFPLTEGFMFVFLTCDAYQSI